jgi:hypothetical protein
MTAMLDAVRRVGWFLARHPWVLTLALCVPIDLTGVRGVDLAAQDFRVWQFRAHGFQVLDLGWYGGHATLGYSVLFPVVGSLIGAMPATALAATWSSALFARVLGEPLTPARAWARIWFAVFVVSDVVVGSGPFACSLAFGLAAILAVQRRYPAAAALAALLTSLFSPLGAAFLLLAAAAWLPTIGWRRCLPLAPAGVGLAVSAIVGDGGVFPFPWVTFAAQLAVVAIGLLVAPRQQVVLRRGLILFGAACIALFIVPNPVGGNIGRLATLLLGPVAVYVLLKARRLRVLLVLTAPMLMFQTMPVLSSLAYAADNPSSHSPYYDNVLSFLTTHVTVAQRVEIPLTHDHWEATYVAEKVDLARGWYRQVDVQRNGVLYDPLTATAYRQWLDDNAVAYVALPDAPLDAGGRAEAALLSAPPPWLHLVYHDAHWRVWSVAAPTPIATGAAALTSLASNGFQLTADHAGLAHVRVRWSPYWHVDATTTACVQPAPDGWTDVQFSAPGTIQVSARLRIDNDSRCPRPATG